MKKKLTIYIFLIAALGIALSTLFGIWSHWDMELDAAQTSLGEMLSVIEAQGEPEDGRDWVEILETAAPDKRLTIIAPDGTVLVDSLGEVTENHANRPEIQDAIANTWGSSQRPSDTAGETLVYVAKLFADGNVGRMSMPIESVSGLALEGIVRFLLVSLLALAVTLLLARKLAVNTAEPLERKEEELILEGDRIEEVRSEFAANVSHELKTPLTSIKGFTDMLSTGMVKDPADQKRFITMIGVEVDRLIELINDVLKISELESVIIPHPDEQGDPLAVAQEIVEMLTPNAQQADVYLAVHGKSAPVVVGESRLREVLINLVENAIKYNLPGGRVEVEVDRQKEWGVITVRDTGIGIPEDRQERVFERFYRVDKGRARTTGGTGLGLSIVKHVVQLYDGTIHLESTLGKGTTITIRFKLAEG